MEEKTSLLNKVDSLEFEAETDHAIIGKHKDQIEILESKVKNVEAVVSGKDFDLVQKHVKLEAWANPEWFKASRGNSH